MGPGDVGVPQQPPGLNMTKLNEIAAEWDPTPFLQAIEKAAVEGGAMDMFGSTNSPTGAPAAAGMDFNSVFGEGKVPGPQQGMPQIPGGVSSLLQPSAAGPMASAVAPRGPGPQMQFPGMPQLPQVPNLSQILGGK